MNLFCQVAETDIGTGKVGKAQALDRQIKTCAGKQTRLAGKGSLSRCFGFQLLSSVTTLLSSENYRTAEISVRTIYAQVQKSLRTSGKYVRIYARFVRNQEH